ncbi:OLC1v1008085C1 [Oldenlandia corymbosa var. corymbosa]|uniref:OLC1v1008085C1 n=1 Tax=Oldenlandia corymbosa var. corymbosa TaxID=529605 RepID=A0AAV1DN91_OLDCO|nr:OLC1v1008085C1 [Oldenlandia corymbosa var. corymbosa]
METFFLYLPLYLALYMVTRHFIGKIRNLPPSPILNLPILGHLYLLRKPIFRILAKISGRYGPVLLLHFGSRQVLVVSSPEAAEECLNKHDIIFANRPALLSGKHLGYNYTSLVWAPYGDHWRNLRKISSLEIFSAHRLQMLQGIRVDEVKLMLRRLYFASQAKQSVNMKTVFFELLSNIIMRMAAGKRYYGGDLDEIEEAEQANRFKMIVEETMRVAGPSNIEDYLPLYRWLTLDKMDKKLRVLQQKRDGFMQELINEFKMKRQEEMIRDHSDKKKGENHKTLIEVLLELQEKEPNYYKDEIIRGYMLVLLASGTDTSRVTMEWALSLMLNHPTTLKKAQEEIDNVIGNDRLLDESDVVNLPYLRCIVNETLRMYPAGPLLPHQSSEECVVGGYRVPKGTMLLVNLWAIQNDPKIWENPRKFEPERFEGVQVTKDGYKWMPFGAGRRGCAGESLATRTVGFALGSIIQCFHWERIGKEMIDMAEGSGLSLSKVQPLIANCQPRPEMVHLLSQL